MVGTIDATGTISADRIAIQATVLVVQNTVPPILPPPPTFPDIGQGICRNPVTGGTSPGQWTATISADAIIDIPVPFVGDASTPIFAETRLLGLPFAFTPVANGGFTVRYVANSGQLKNPRFTSTDLGSSSLVPGWRPDEPIGEIFSGGAEVRITQILLPAEDVVRLSVELTNKFEICKFLSIPFGGNPNFGAATFDMSIEALFQTVSPILGNGDVNADGSRDILDIALMRRVLAELPISITR